jgi:hypothetical protein
MKSYIYQNKTYHASTSTWLNITRLNSSIYHYDTFSNQGNVSAIDTDTYIEYPINQHSEPLDEKATGPPYMGGRIGLGSGRVGITQNNILVDWIRVIKAPVVEPTILLGATESANYGWENNEIVYSKNIIVVNPGGEISDPFTPGPVLRDFNYGTSDSTFIIKNMPPGEYTITATMGNMIDTCSATSIDLTFGEEEYTYFGKLTIPTTERGEFETKWLSIDIPPESIEGKVGTLKLTFHSDGSSWTVNSILLEKGNKGIIVRVE